MRYVRGRVIDVGCGAGRVALHLQQRGFDVVGVDASPLAARIARQRGVKKVQCSMIGPLTGSLGTFDTIVLFGNNFGIFGSPQRLRRALSAWGARTPPGARILAESTSPYFGGAPALDRPYSLRNRRRGLSPGECRLRVRYRDCATPWFDWLFVSRSEMRALLEGTGWHQARILGTTNGDPYVGVLEKN